MATIAAMDGRSISIAVVVILALTGLPGHALAPRPSPEARVPAPPPLDEATSRQAIRVSPAEQRCLALNVYWESRGQPLSGQAAVAHVTLNRLQHPGYPATICGVVYQGARDGACQFGWACDDRSNQPAENTPAWAEAQDVARRALAGDSDPTKGALYFHGIHERPQWARGRYANRVVIGGHVFFAVKEENRQLAQAADP